MSDSFTKPPRQSITPSRGAPKTESDPSRESNVNLPATSMKIRPVTRRRPSKTVIDYTPATIGEQSARERKVRVKPEFSVRGTVSMRVVHEKSRCRGYPTLFRPEVGAVGGSIDHNPKASPFALILVAALTLVVANSSPMDKLVQMIQSERATAQASTWIPERKAPALFSPLFGPTAVLECHSNCDSRAENEILSCKKNCEALSLAEFAKQGTAPRSAELDANQIVDSCMSNPLEKARVLPGADSIPELKSSLAVFQKIAESKASGDFATARLQLSQLTKLMGTLKFPAASPSSKKQEELTEKVLRASCLRAHLSLTEIARILTHQNSDEWSERYFTALATFVRQPIAKLETELKKEDRPSNSRKPLKNS